MVQTPVAPRIDGVLDEEIWADAAVVSDLHQMDPIEYSEPSEQSEFYLAYDQDALYVGARMRDSQPGRIAANILRQGANISNDDLLLVILDPYNNGREGYEFQLNPNGVRYEGLFLGASQMQWNWDGIWQAAATQNDEGWLAEMAIPFKTLSFDAENDVWGINFGRRSQANFNPALGYLNRSGIRDFSAEIGWIHRRPQEARIRTIHTLVGYQRVDHIARGLQSEVLDGRVIGLTLPAVDSVRLLYRASREVLREPFTIWDPDASSGEQPITSPAGEFTYAAPALYIQSESSRKLSGEMTYRRGGFYGGERNNIEVETTWFPTRHFRGFVSYGYNDIELPEGDFTLKLARVGLDIIFSNTLSWASLVQYDNGSETIGINSRLHWVPEAGREGFIVLNHNLLDLDRNDSFNSSLSGLSLKFSHTFRF